MSKDLQNAVNNFVVGFSLGDRVMARHDAAEAARQKWQTMLEWRKADTAEKAKRNASYDAQSKAHSDLMAAQAEWYRKRGPGGGGKISVGSTGKPAFSPADQAYIDKQVAAGYAPPTAQAAPEQPSISVEMPEQPPPPIGAMPSPPDSGSSGPDPTTSMFSDAHGGMVPRVPFHATGVSGTSGPGSGYGVRAAPPSYQAGGDVKKKFQWGPWYDPLRYTLPPSRKPPPAPTSPTPATPATGTAPAQSPATTGGGAGATTEPDVPYVDPEQRNASGTSYASEPDVPPQGVPTRSGRGSGRGAIDTGPWKKLGDQTRIKAYDPTLDAADRRNIGIIDAAGRVNQQAYRASPMMHPEAYPEGTDQFTSGPDYSARWNNTNVFGSPPPEDRAMTWRRGGPVRSFAFGGPTGGTVENLNYASPAPQLNLAGGSANAATGSGGDSTGGVSGTGGVGGSASDSAGGSAAAGTSGDAGSDGSGTYRRGGRVRRRAAISTRYRAGGAVTPEYQDPPGDDDDQPTIEYHGYGTDYGTPRHARPYKPYYGPRKEEPAWIQRNDDNDYGYGDENVGPAPGREVPTMARGGRVQRYDEGGGVDPNYSDPHTESNVPGTRQSGPMAPDTSGYDAPVKLRLEYESRLPGASPEQKAAAWGDYKIRMKRLDPSIKFEDETDSNAGTERSSDDDIHPPLPTNRGAGSYPSEPDVPPQGRVESRPPARRGAIDTGRWKGLRDKTREEAYDPVLDRDDRDNVHMVDDTGQVNPQQGPPAPGPTGGGPGQQAGEGAMGGYGLNPQGANAQGAGLSTNNVHNDFTPIMKAASDFAGHVFHLTANDEHTAGGYHALMAGHGAAPINMIEQGFQKLDPQGKMPVNQKIELLSQHLYDYYVGQGKPEMASKVAFEVAQFGSVMAKKQAGQAGDLLQGGDFDGAMTHLTAGYNWLVDGHTADYDPRSRMVTLRDSKSGEVTGQIPATPDLVKNLTLGMSSGELNWDIMRGRGSLPHPGAPPQGQLPSRQMIPGTEQPPPSRPVVQPAAAPAGPPQTPAAPEIPQGDATGPGVPGGSPATQQGYGPQVAQAVQPAPPPNLTSGRNTVITSTPPPPGPSNRSAQPQPTPSGSQPAPTGSQPTQTKQPAQGDQTGEPEEGSEAWYEKHPHDIPRGPPMRRASSDLPPPPDIQGERNRIELTRRTRIAQLMSDAKGLSQSGKSLIPQFIAQTNTKADKELADLETRRKEWLTELKDQDHQEAQLVEKRALVGQSSEGNVDGKLEEYFVNKRKGFDDLDQVAEAKRIREEFKKTGHTDAKGEQFNMVAQAPLRYMATPDDRAKLREIAAQIWASNTHPGMSERQAAEHALNFTSLVAPDAKGHNNNSGDNARTYRKLGTDTLGNIVLENEAHEKVWVHPETLRLIENMRAANAIEFANETGQRRRTQSERAARGDMGTRILRGLANNPLLGIPREAGELAAPKDAK